MRNYRITKLDGLSVWRVEVQLVAIWPLCYVVKPRWFVARRLSVWLDRSLPAEFDTEDAAAMFITRRRDAERERLARRQHDWRVVR